MKIKVKKLCVDVLWNNSSANVIPWNIEPTATIKISMSGNIEPKRIPDMIYFSCGMTLFA